LIFNHPRLGIGAVKNRKVALGAHVLAQQRFDFLDDKAGLVVFIGFFANNDLIAFGILREQRLVFALRVGADQVGGGTDNCGSGAVIFLELDDPAIRKILFEGQN